MLPPEWAVWPYIDTQCCETVLRLMKKCLIAILVLLVCSALNSCYTNYNQRLYEKYRSYTGYDLNYDKTLVNKTLKPVLYRAGKDWYLAGVSCDVSVIHSMPPWHFITFNWYDRNDTFPVYQPSSRVYYHKITPELAKSLQKIHPSKLRISDGEVASAMKRAGGQWVSRLPRGAKAVPAPSLDNAHWVLVDPPKTQAPWYIHTASVLTFVGMDMPYAVVCSALGVAAGVVASPVVLCKYVTDYP